jgi:heat shock protein HtpX
VTTILTEILLAILASIVVFWFSRRREYRADSGAAVLVGKKPMIEALETLRASINKLHLPDEMAAFGISGARKRGLAALFATHPPLEDRIRALQESASPDSL